MGIIIEKSATYEQNGDVIQFECLTQPETHSSEEVRREQAYQLLLDAFRAYTEATQQSVQGVRRTVGRLEVVVELEVDN